MAFKVSEDKERGMTTIGVACCVCRKEHHIEAPTEAIHAWLKGTLVQDALPMLSPDDREMLVSGICSECFDKLFS